MRVRLVLLLTFLIGCQSAYSEVPDDARVLIDFDAEWLYHDGDRDLGTEWVQADYDDRSWSSGPAILGYDTMDRAHRWPRPGLQTKLVPNLITYYFRTEFHFEETDVPKTLYLEQIIDDGAVYYLNGEEIARSALMPESEISHRTQTTASTNPWKGNEVLVVPGDQLRPGRNVLAVSVHNHQRNSSDISFALRLSVATTAAPPLALYLTWQRDPTTTMTVHWHTEGATGPAEVEVSPLEGGTSHTVAADTGPMRFSPRQVHTAEITDLKPATTYRFRLMNIKNGVHSAYYQFETMPATASEPLRIVFGGDVRHRKEWMEQTNREALRFDPHFIVWGGDLAYADGLENRLYRWYEFFDAMLNTLVTDEGRVIPVIFGIGNHEIRGHYYWGNGRGREAYRNTNAFRERIAPYYYNLFAFPGHPGYGALDFGDYLSILLLDTDHSGPVEGAQTDWLEEALASRAHIPNVIPVYHVTAFPSVRPYEDQTSQRIRQHWLPLFEAHGVELAFEHHDHAYKRTVPILSEAEHPGGILYIGDGAWGVGTRNVREASGSWYLERSQSIRHLILLSLQGDSRDLKVISHEGKLIDHVIDRVGQRRDLRDSQ